MSGSHTLERLVNDVARDVRGPGGEGLGLEAPAGEASRGRVVRRGPQEDPRRGPTCAWAPLGSGSDYTAFIDHLGVASLNLGYGGEDDGGIYHSIYDSFYWYTQFSDRDFVYGKALAQTVGLAVMRLADADLLPFEFGALADTTQEYLKELKKLLAKKQDEIAERNRQLDDGVFAATNDPRRPTVAPPRAEVPPHLEFAPLENAVDALQKSAGRYTKARRPVEGRSLPAETLARVNATLIRSERVLLSPEGLLRRPWFKHLALRARHLLRLRREDDAGRPRGDRAEALLRGRRRDRPHREGAAGRGSAGGRRGGRAGGRGAVGSRSREAASSCGSRSDLDDPRLRLGGRWLSPEHLAAVRSLAASGERCAVLRVPSALQFSNHTRQRSRLCGREAFTECALQITAGGTDKPFVLPRSAVRI